jgi:hypothetical protein
MTQFAMNWGLLAGALLIGLPTMWAITDTTVDENVVDDDEPRKSPSIQDKA